MIAQTLSDKELIANYIAGDESNLQILIQRYKRKVFSYIFFIVKEKNLADDIFQDTFIKVINTLKAGNYNEEGKFLPWVSRIAHNLIIDHFRKARKIPYIDNGYDYDAYDLVKVYDECVETKLVVEQIHCDIKRLVEYLPDEQKEVLKMRHYSEMSFKEIAEQTGVSINTALGRMRYALINLRKLIKENDVIVSI
ncbi:MAG: sigma-70 family RNA polymerase sigma factor [Bacteroidales bacterium]|nr:sigma-70 family RNA polymerase sigma factor [Bacteroidales bacterium]